MGLPWAHGRLTTVPDGAQKKRWSKFANLGRFRALLRAKVSLAFWLFRVTYCFPSMQGLIQNNDNPTELLQSCIGSI